MSQKPKILLVEDDQASMLLLKQTSKNFTDQVQMAYNGEEGLRIFKEFKPDLVISDIGMPIMDGLKMSNLIKEINPNQRIIITSAFDDKTTLLNAIDAGVSNYLTKPINVSKVKEKVESELNVIQLEKQVLNQTDQINMLSKAIESSSSMIIILDNNLNIVYTNPSFLEHLSYTSSDIPNLKLEFHFDDDEMKSSYLNFINNKNLNEYWKGDFSIKSNLGKEIHLSSTISPISNDHLEITNYVQTFEDITHKVQQHFQLKESHDFLESEVRKRTIELENALTIAESANKAKSLFLAKVSHELRTPLNGILGMTSVLIDSDLSPSNVRKLQIVESSGESLLKLINDVIDYSQIQSDNLTIVQESFDFKKTVYETIALLQPLSEKKGLNLILKIDEKLPSLFVGDKTRIRQIITNIVNNAIKFTEEGFVEVLINSSSNNLSTYNIKIQVKDTGIGIPKDKQNKLFKSFSQVDNKLSRKYGGTGLGLSITKDLIEKLAGKISFESEDLKGSTFTIELPLKISDPENDKKAESNDILINEILAKNTDLTDSILIAEDSEINLAVFQEILGRSNLKVDIAENGLEAFQLAKTKDYSIIFMDIQMPVMDGYESSKRILSEKPSSVIIALTANLDQSVQKKTYEIGLKDLLLKPIKWDLFFNRVRSASSSNTVNNDVVDLSTLLDNINYSKTTLERIYNSFKSNFPESIKTLKNAIIESDNEKIYKITHKLKSELSNFNANDCLASIILFNQKSESSEYRFSESEINELFKRMEKVKEWFENHTIESILKN